MRHNAFVYDSDADYVARSVAFLREGLNRGEAAIVANTRDGLAMMRDGLADDAERVAFLDVSPIYTRPARTIAAYYGALSEQLQSAPSVRAAPPARNSRPCLCARCARIGLPACPACRQAVLDALKS